MVIAACGFHESLWGLDEAVDVVALLEDPFLRERARAYYLTRMGEHQEAVRAVEAALAIDGRDALANAILAFAVSSSPAKREGCQVQIQKALAAGPDNAHVAFLVSWAYAKLGQPAMEEAYLRRAGELDPGRYLHHPNLADSLWAQDRIPEAVDCLRAWMDRNPADAYPRMRLAMIESLRGDLDGALDRIREAIALQPTYAPAHEQLGLLLGRKGRREEAEAAYRVPIEVDPKGRWISAQPFFRLAKVCEEREEVEESLRLLETALGRGRSGVYASAFDAVCSRIAEVTLRHDAAPLWEPLDRIGEAIRATGKRQDDRPNALAVLALAHLRGRAMNDAAEALRLAEQAKETAKPDDPVILGTLAEALSANGRETEAIRTLELCIELPDAPRSAWERLVRIRAAGADDPVSFASIDAVLSTWDADPEKDLAYLARVRERVAGAGAIERVAYLEGRIAQRADEYAKAIEIFERLRASESREPVVSLRLAENLRASGRAAEAERVLREALGGPCADDVAAWALWLSIRSADLGQHAMEILADVPGKSASDGARSGLAADVAWTIEQLATGGAIRINAGGADLIDERGRTWAEDRFFRGGAAESAKLMESLPPLCRTFRRFPAEGLHAAYRIPLPAGRYEVTLHMAETYFDGQGLRRFAARIQGTEVFRAYDPRASIGFGKPDARACGAFDVRDGLLRIEFIPEIDDPMVSAIEVVRLPA